MSTAAVSPGRNAGKTIFSGIGIVFMALMTLCMVVPFLWMIITSLQPDSSAVLTRPLNIPWPPRFSNYAKAWVVQPFGIYAVNSLITAVSATVLQLITAILAAYAFTNLRFPGKNFLFILVLAVLMMPTQVAIIPLYSTISKLGWLDTFKGLIIPFAVDAYGVFLIKQNFSTIPKAYVEAARIEGAGHGRIAFTIMGVLAQPALIAYALMAFKWRWNDYFWVLIMTSSINRRTMPVGIVMMKEVSDGGTQWHLLMAATIIVLAPMIILYLALQKYFTNDYMKGGMKG
ncbi:carbohydrate ABC transporter permease [Breznakiella homolactica]|uniref:sn-glycerol-3-phosphate transport system permease protein UgpE n=1 Tax=Breznakiella homolactica TaxID=2798577 RepID=A0A7T8B9J0_9SPIR|nr:carbohydrate ABC transporter permease [Breznakiella homolactica]QQO08376.1 carbohydrate ABC transporter permease [Breznakiella homolactica]